MREVLVVVLATLLLLMAGVLPVFAAGEVPPNVQISEQEMKGAKPAGEAITIEMMEEEGDSLWEKYLYVDMDQDLNEDSQTLWTRVGTRKGNLDLSVGWTQKFNEPALALKDKGLISLSVSIWW